MVTSTLAVTAAHCLTDAPMGATFTVRFGPDTHIVTVVDSDVALDIAVLKFPAQAALPPALPLLARPGPATNHAEHCRWHAFGFPPAIDLAREGFTLSGTITDLFGNYAGQPAIQLFCEQGANQANFRTAIFGGVSGGPVAVNRDGENHIFGIVLDAPPAVGERAIFARPIEVVLTRFAAHLDPPVRSWDATAGRAVVVLAEDGSVKSNIDEAFVAAAWRTRLTGVWCNVPPDQTGAFPGALARLLIHAPVVGVAPLYLKMAVGWRHLLSSTARRWVPVDTFQSGQIVHDYGWNEPSEPAPVEGDSYPSTDSLALAIHRLCDQWILTELRNSMGELFAAASTAPLLKFEIAADLRARMQPLWNTWNAALQADPVLLHHFLTLLVTECGDYDAQTPAAGAGPKTLAPCLIRALAFSLAVCSCLPRIAVLKHPAPGNIGSPGLAGHVCGIGLYNGQLLHLDLGSHQWSTPVVMVPNCYHLWAQLRAAGARLNETAADASLKRDPPRLVLTGDVDLMIALRESRTAFDNELRRRCVDFATLEEAYTNQSIQNA